MKFSSPMVPPSINLILPKVQIGTIYSLVNDSVTRLSP